ncbi:MAG: DUF1206 domain-containing protein [Planctomycetota bacterium]|nr:MAG: DUF1206 domain-containing protein [Planctomycetota bacterium]
MHAGTIPQWVEYFARFGYAAKAVIYGLIGVLAIQVAIGNGGSLEGSQGALSTIRDEPFGRAVLGVLAIALLGYVAWRWMQALYDTEGQGNDAKGMVKRIGYAVSGVIYAALAFWAGSVAAGMGSSSGGGDSSKQSLTAKLMSMPFGVWLVGLVGLIIIGVAIMHARRAYTAKFMQRYNLSELSAKARHYLMRVGQFGLAARAVTFAIIGGFVIIAAIRTDPSQVKGLGGALETLRQQAYGPWLLGIVAAGMIAYAVYCAANSRYRYFNIESAG